MPDTLHEATQQIADAIKPRLRGVLHQVAFAMSLVTGTVLISLAHGAMGHVAAAVYAGSVALLFGTSAAYHRRPWSPRTRNLMERLDHSMIFVLIAGSYTPFTLLLLDGWLRWTSLGVVWGGAVAGIVIRNSRWEVPRWFAVGIYLAQGWVAIGIMPQLLHEGGVAVIALLAAGGLCYTLGAVVYARKHPNPSPHWFGFHEVFHAFTLAAFACHYVAVSLTIYRA